MKVSIAVTLVFMLLEALCEEKYTTKYDSVDIEQILKNERLLLHYVECVLDKGPCTPDAAELKRHMTEALQTNCSKCSQAQRNIVQKAIQYLARNKKELFKEIQEKYDPTGEYKAQYANFIE